MAKYRFKAKKGPREIIEDVFEAESEAAVANEIQRRGYYPLSIALAGGRTGLSKTVVFRKKIKLGDLAFFARQLADLLGAGLPLFRALGVLEEQSPHPMLKQIIVELREDIRDGKSLSEAMKKHGRSFPPIFSSMVKAGELGGFMETVLENLAGFCEKEQEIREKIRGAMVYPLLMMVVGIGSIVVLLTLVVPRLIVMFEDTGQQLPWITELMIGISRGMETYWWQALIVIILSVVILKRVMRTPEGQLARDKIKLGIPLVGKIILKTEISQMTRTLGALLSNGVPVLSALEMIGESISNQVIRDDIKKAAEEVKRGASLGHVLKKSPFMPPLVTNMVTVGEESGQVEKALGKIAIAYEREVDRAVKNFTTLLEPMMILTMGVIVLVIVVSMMLPIFQMNAALK